MPQSLHACRLAVTLIQKSFEPLTP